MSPAALFTLVQAGPDEVEAVASLDDAALCRLTGHLRQDYDENAASGRVLGICLVESAQRFMRLTEGGKES